MTLYHLFDTILILFTSWGLRYMPKYLHPNHDPNSDTLNSSTLRKGTLNSGTLRKGTLNSDTLRKGTLRKGTLNSGTLRKGT